ncbi:MAG: RNA polymerase subunit sigma-24 [Lachnospiraceae bacterium]|nr:RNA polymerase subunit sigma-24 [Lachnospiraceae bacterium]
MEEMAILYGVPKVAYGVDGCTPFPICVRSCAEYLGVRTSYTKIMAECGAAFRLVWDTSCWNGGNVDAVFTFDDPQKVFACGMRSINRTFRMLPRTQRTTKEEFISFIRSEIDGGNPVIALGIIGPPEACVITGYRNQGNTLMGWNVFQEYPEHQSSVTFETNGYFITDSWWENPDTCGLIATGTGEAASFSLKEVLRNASEVLEGRMDNTLAKGLTAYDAWRNALLRDRDFPEEPVFPILVERMMCHGDAMDCLSDGRKHAAAYLRGQAACYPQYREKLNAAANMFEAVSSILWNEMIPVLGGWERGEAQMKKLFEKETRRTFAGMIDRMKRHEEWALVYIRDLIREMTLENRLS